MSVTPNMKLAANYMRGILGGSPKVIQYCDDARENSVHILSADGTPDTNSTTYVTLGLAEQDVATLSDGDRLGVEIILLAHGILRDFAANVLATCAFNALKDGFLIAPEAVHRNVITMYHNGQMKHVMFVDPFLWNLETLKAPGRAIAWLFAVPISDGELALVESGGATALQDLLEKHDVDVGDILRASVV